MNSKDIGNISEAYVLAKLLELGFICSKPVGDNAPYDLIIDKDSILLKIQIKTACKVKQAYQTSFRRVRINTKKMYSTFYSKLQVDYFLSFNPFNYEIYVFKNDGAKSVSLRDTPAKSGRKQGIHMTKDFLLTKDSFR